MAQAVANVVGDGSEAGTWINDVAASGWYDSIGALLAAARCVVNEVADFRGSVLVHSIDGWDRVPQVTCLAMLCLDGRHRTQKGFLRLIQKEWCTFGHPFSGRLALSETPSSEYSPVFVQWLECVYQLCCQRPQAFEFTPSVLLRLAYEAFSNRYGTFLLNSDKERTRQVLPKTLSLWSELLRPEEVADWQNADFVPETAPLRPNVCQLDIAMWKQYWFRYHLHMHNPVPHPSSQLPG
eukprot:NODE_2138_length_988_cov_277.232583.p1 GENE.NODE_2138_length_988_cov_277.232583~~NODE_2138_length_988_cov_277.232583.p1  ORF type:complete len:257 (-),score=59.48 NODE_2138_length_988_cov_277.232583:201-914(-)